MATLIDKLIKDFPEQFKGGENTNAVCEALDRQIADLRDAFDGIQLMTSLDTAEGKQLDYIGDILNLTRAEAAILCGETIFFDTLDDEVYRRYLKYRAIQLTSDCTYYSLIESLKAILGDDITVIYSEDASQPATIILDVDTDDEGKLILDAIPPIKSAGVAVQYSTSFLATIEIQESLELYYSAGLECGTHECGTWPPNTIKVE